MMSKSCNKNMLGIEFCQSLVQMFLLGIHLFVLFVGSYGFVGFVSRRGFLQVRGNPSLMASPDISSAPSRDESSVDRVVKVMRLIGKGSPRSKFEPARCTFFAMEGLNYSEIHRTAAANDVAFHMKRRQIFRKESGSPTDKSLNGIIAVPGSPGSGKTAFFAHFGASYEYLQYLNETHFSRGKRNKKPIIAPVTFNLKMTDSSVSFGLRVLYGAAFSMGSFTLNWVDFTDRLHHFRDITVFDAIRVLREIFGPRRVLILVDELVKAEIIEEGADEKVMTAIGDLLSLDQTVDVVVSALSPMYVRNLVTKISQRPIVYLPLSPLYDLEQGKMECKQWADHVLKGYTYVDPYVRNLCQRAVRLVSGHPRSIEKVLKEFKEPVLNKNRFAHLPFAFERSFPDALQWMAETMIRVCDAPVPSPMCFEDVVLTCREISILEEPLVRSDLETGAIHIQPRPGQRAFSYAVPLMALVHLPNLYTAKEVAPFPMLSTFIKLTGAVSKFSQLWERCLDATILARSAPGTNIFSIRVRQIFGIDDYMEDSIACLPPVITDHASFNTYSLNENLILTVPVDNQPGYDSKFRVKCIDGRQLVVATLAKVDRSSKRHIDEVHARAIVNTVHSIMAERDCEDLQLQDLLVVFYDNGAIDRSMNWDNVTATAADYMMLKLIRKEMTQKRTDQVIEYLQRHRENVHVVPQSKLKEWLIPSFVDLPSLGSDA